MVPVTTVDRARFDRAAAIAEQAVRAGTHPGVVLAIANRTETVWTRVFSNDNSVTFDSIFLLASITKPIVATAIMQLVERGLLQLHTPITTYIPEFGVNGKQQVTAWHLLTHTSGLEGERWEIELSRRAAPAQAYIDAACRSTLHWTPGTQVEYCSLSFWVLGELIARLSGQHYTHYLHEQIFAPLGMHATAFQPADAQRVVPIYDQHPAAIAYLNSLHAPGGGLWSNAADLVTFGQTLLNGGLHGQGRLLAPATIDLMTRLHTAGLHESGNQGARPATFGLGWRKPAPDTHPLASAAAFGHGGLTGTYLWIDPQRDLMFVLLSNRWGVGHDLPLRALHAVYAALEVGA